MPGFTDITATPISSPKEGENGYTCFRVGHSEILKKGSTMPSWTEGERTYPLECDIIYERDIEIKVRDGARLYTDILRPANTDEKLPVLVMWSPYGKEYSSVDMLPVCTWKCGIKASELSGREKFEGLDPARWCPKGYAIANVDIRGAGNSDGIIEIMTQRMAEDCYDVIEALAKFEWSNGNVGMAGNSFLAISQWMVAQLKPPSLKAIAPWDGSADVWREQIFRGGKFNLGNMALITKLIFRGKNGAEYWDDMFERFPLACEYWNEKRAKLDEIDIPCFITGSDVGSIHTMGAVRGWLEIKSKHKWIKWEAYQEWFELYSVPENRHELMQFFDTFLRGEKNDFVEKTPRVRWSLLQYGDRDAITDVVLDDFPPRNTEYKTMYLSAESKLSDATVSQASVQTFDSASATSGLTFDLKFDKDTNILGLPKAHLFMSCPDHDDWTVFVRLCKLDKNGKVLSHLTVPRERSWAPSIDEIKPEDQTGLILHLGSFGMLRASHRAIDRSRSIHENFPFHPHDKVEKIKPGTIIELEIGIWATGVRFDQGESLQVHISGWDPRNPELVGKFGARHRVEDDNVGRLQLHTGGQYASRVVLPFVPVS